MIRNLRNLAQAEAFHVEEQPVGNQVSVPLESPASSLSIACCSLHTWILSCQLLLEANTHNSVAALYGHTDPQFPVQPLLISNYLPKTSLPAKKSVHQSVLPEAMAMSAEQAHNLLRSDINGVQ
jgi:hypothetical protein